MKSGVLRRKSIARAGCLYGMVLALGMMFVPAAAYANDPGLFYSNGPRGKKAVALTFDDGPGTPTREVLAVLKRYQVKATFFMEGSQVDLRPAVAAEVLADGHEIGSHLYSHPDFYHYKKPDAGELLAREMDKSAGAIEKATGKRPYLLRMPHGYAKPWVKETARQKGYVLVNWTFGCDWKKMDSPALARAYVKAIKPGAIFLMHDGGRSRPRTLAALPVLIEELKKQGYEIVTVRKLLELEGREMVLKPAKKKR
ncbi:MAG: polysaccharide deacetylase family protein [Endomicrobiales bacterium]